MGDLNDLWIHRDSVIQSVGMYPGCGLANYYFN